MGSVQEHYSIGKGVTRIRLFAGNGVWNPTEDAQIRRKTKVLELQNVQISKAERIALRLTPGHVNAR
jgi:hypothetical protein